MSFRAEDERKVQWHRVRRVRVNEKQKRCYREPTTPPGFVEAARSRNLELIRRRYIIHDTTGPAGSADWLFT